ncbi:MAG TPA: lytic transglycosylase F [Rhizobiaceae bacterium]|nr:lytic transglycosylase F [Rhizobiaceae bacterium]
MLGNCIGALVATALAWGSMAIGCAHAEGASATSIQATNRDAVSEEDRIFAKIAEPWTSDFDGMLERGLLRVGVAYGPLFFVADGPKTSGMTVDLMNEFGKHLARKFGAMARKLEIVLAPLARDRLLPALENGHVDLVVANLTITPERLKHVDFSDPFVDDVSEVVVTGPGAPRISSIDDLDGVEISVRASSSYYEHLNAMSARREAAGQKPLKIVRADENLEDEDLIELVHVGALEATVADAYKADLFAQIFEHVAVRHDLVVNKGGEIAWAMRKGSPQLAATVNDFVKVARRGSSLGNILIKRYFKDADRIRNAMDPDGRSRFAAVIGLIRKYATAYDFDALMIAAQGYQESHLDQSKHSRAGAVGIMQVLPSTASDPAIGIPHIEIADRNVEAGVKMLRLLRSTYVNDPAINPVNQALMAFAAYNAGPGNLQKARRRAVAMGLDDKVWFGNVELAMAKVVGNEPVVYVRNILKYYITYRLAEAHKAAK